MNFIKKGIGALLIAGLLVTVSCKKDEEPNPTGLTEITLSSIEWSADGDGTIVTVSPVSVGATSLEIDFGDPNSTEDVFVIEQGGSATYDYPNEVAEVTYTLTVTAQSDKGLTPVTKTEDIDVTHVPDATITTAPDSPEGSVSNVFAIFTDGLDWADGFLAYRWGEPASGGTAVAVEDNNLLRLSRLGTEGEALTVKTITPSVAFGDGIAATHMHLDVFSEFAEGIDVLKVTLVNTGGSEEYVVDGLNLTDGEWVSFDLDLAADFSASVSAIDSIIFELGTGGTANDHASIFVDNIYLYKETGSTIINGDFAISGTYATSQWRFTTFTDGNTNPFGSSSDGSNFDINGVNTGSKTRGAKWSSSQAAGQLASPDSRYATQALKLTPNTDYVLEYQYAIDDDNDEIIGGRHLVGLILDGHYIDGADAVDDVSSNIGYHQGFYAEGKFGSSPNGYGTFAQIPFTSDDSGEVSVMFYSVAPDDAWIDNVKVVEAVNATAPTTAFTPEESSVSILDYTFVNESLNGVSFEWNFGDGSNISTEKSPMHTYAAPGDYTVTLTSTNVAGSTMESVVVSIAAAAVDPTFKVIVQNGTADDHGTSAGSLGSTSDNADAWDMTPNSTILDEAGTVIPSPYKAVWSNSALNTYIDGAYCANEQPGSSGDGNRFAQLGDRGVKLYESCRRLYQALTVEVGVEYTFTIDSRSEASGIPTEVYILNTAIADETGIDANGASDPSVDAFFLIENDFNATKSSTTLDTFTTSTFKFKPSTTEIVIYVRAPNAVSGTTEVFYDNIDIITPGF